ncbi:hypothetical protein FN846DRAFT_310510 [Sphaerosporella brunnea]|uniref:Uncharacterized protein n=1 Tax=Sphaerosporella brunnea TaxID=1250544 RepID=A0A5J5F6Z6_9PEZI|nr:hypothetical protein FN846DRAFT_310510 [Sphaerosporella brunnea]
MAACFLGWLVYLLLWCLLTLSFFRGASASVLVFRRGFVRFFCEDHSIVQGLGFFVFITVLAKGSYIQGTYIGVFHRLSRGVCLFTLYHPCGGKVVARAEGR